MPHAKPKRPSLKTTKIEISLQSAEKAALVRAAALCRTSLSKFVLEHAYAAAQHVLAEQSDIVMSRKKWDAFRKALDAPPRNVPALRRLLTHASVFERTP
jgi:uncharacterized protein (DUF1778 family)